MATITKRKNGSYKIMVSVGYDVNKKQIRKFTTFTPPLGVTELKAKKLAMSYATEFESKVKGSQDFNENMRFSTLCEWYLSTIAPNTLKSKTLCTQDITLKRAFIPKIGNLKLKGNN
jgi:hypothetical protein